MKKIILGGLVFFINMYCVANTYAGDIVVTTTGGVDEIIGSGIALTGAATGSPEASAASNSTTNSITTNITTLTDNAWLIDIVGSSLNGTFTPDVSQTEQTDQQTGTTGNQRAQGSAATSTKQISPAALSSMIQTHSSGAGSNDLVQAVAAVAPLTTIAIESTSTGNTSTNNNNSLTWTHNFNDPNIDNKLMVGVVVEDRTNACTTGATLSGQSVEISSITHDGTNLTQIAYQTIRIAIGGQDRCLRAELWYLDIVAPPAPQAEWRMDEGSWSGTAGEVSDNSGNGFDGTGLNNAATSSVSPAIAGDPGTCGYGDFPNNASATPADAVDTGLTINSDIGNTGTITLWYNSNANWNGGGDRSILDAGIIGGANGNIYFFLTLLNSGQLRFGYEDTADSDYRINSPVQAFTAGTWVHIAVTWDLPNDTQSIFINGTQVSTGSTAGDTNAIGALNTLYIGDNNGVYIIGGDTTANSANGAIDEVRVFNSALSAAEITAVSNETHGCPATGDITVNFSTNINAINAGAISLTNASLGDPEASATNTNTNTATISTNITTLTDNAWVIDTAGSGNGGTFTPGAGQTEYWDVNIGSATAAMTAKALATAGLTSMSQTHSTTSNRNAHTVISVAPISSSSSIAFDAASSTTTTNSNSVAWTHTLTTTNTANTKIIVGIGFEENGACNDTINSVTYGNIQLTQVVQAQNASGGTCQQVEIWYADLTNIIVSTNNNSTLGGQAIDQDEAVEYDASTDTGSLFLDDATFDANERLTGLHLYANGNVALATATDASIGGNAFQDDDIVEVTPSGTAGVYDFVQVIFDGGTHFTAADERIDAVYVRDNGNIILSTIGPAQLPLCGGGNLNFIDDDLVEWDPTNLCATMFLDESATTNLIPNAGGDEDIVGVHLLNDDSNLILFSLVSNNTIRGTAVLDGDVVLYDRANDTASIFFSEANFTSGGEDIDALTLAVPPFTGSTLQNFVVTVSTTASTCLPTEVTIEARDTTNTIFDYTGTITLTTSTNNGSWLDVDQTPAKSATNPATNTVTDVTADDGAATYLFDVADSGRVGLFLYDQHAETLTITVEDTTVAGSASNPANTVTFSDNVFVITPTTCTGSTCPGTGSYEVVAGRNHVFQVDMVRNDGTSCGVAAGYNNAAQTLKGWVVRHGDDPTGTLASLAEGALSDGIAPGADNVTLDFSGGGTASLTLQTTDVGKFEIFLRDTTNNFAGVDIDGSTGAGNQITVRPFGLGFTSITGLVANPAASIPGGTRFATAGSSYSAFVGGYTYDAADDADSDGIANANADVTDGTSVLTPSYAWVTDVIAVLNTPTLGQGGTLGTFSFSTPNGGSGLIGQLDFSGGQEQVTDFAYFEVGSIRMQADATDFLNSTGVDITGTSNVVGRFGADQFTFTANTPELGPGCGTFTYVDQPFTYTTAPQITARATAADGTTVLSNYADFTGVGGDNWWLLPLTPFSSGSGITMTYTDIALPTDISLDSMATTYSPNTGATGSSGSQIFNLTGPFSYAKNTSPIAEQVPFNGNLRLDFTVTDSDTATGTHTINPITFTNSEQRWGRMVLGNGFGSELLPIEVSISAEYFTADGFVLNTVDNCSTYNSVDMTFSNGSGAITLGNLSLTGNGTLINGLDDPANSILANSTANEIGSADVTIDLTTQDWLQFDWDNLDNNNDGPFDDNPRSRLSWGIFSGPDEFIYIREPW